MMANIKLSDQERILYQLEFRFEQWLLRRQAKKKLLDSTISDVKALINNDAQISESKEALQPNGSSVQKRHSIGSSSSSSSSSMNGDVVVRSREERERDSAYFSEEEIDFERFSSAFLSRTVTAYAIESDGSYSSSLHAPPLPLHALSQTEISSPVLALPPLPPSALSPSSLSPSSLSSSSLSPSALLRSSLPLVCVSLPDNSTEALLEDNDNNSNVLEDGGYLRPSTRKDSSGSNTTDTSVSSIIDDISDVLFGDPLQESRDIYNESVFGSYVASELMSLPEIEARFAKIEILKVLNKYTRNNKGKNDPYLSIEMSLPSIDERNILLKSDKAVRKMQRLSLAESFGGCSYEDSRNIPHSTSVPSSWSSI